jgi:HEAT repeat protein
MSDSDFLQVLNVVGNTDRKLSHRDLRKLTDIGRESEDAFYERWRSIDASRRRAIVHAMVEMAEENAEFDYRDVFTACLRDVDPNVRETAAEGLWDDDRPRTMRQLISMMNTDDDTSVRAACALSLGQFALRASLDELRPSDAEQLRRTVVGAANDLDLPVDVRRRALESAGYFTGTDVDEAIAGAYASGVESLKASSLVAIGHSLDTRWLPIVEAELRSETPALRYEAARASGEYGEHAASLLPSLFDLAGGNDPEVFTAAIWALGQIGGDAARRTLRRLANDDDPTRQEAAADALSELEFAADPSRLV